MHLLLLLLPLTAGGGARVMVAMFRAVMFLGRPAALHHLLVLLLWSVIVPFPVVAFLALVRLVLLGAAAVLLALPFFVFVFLVAAVLLPLVAGRDGLTVAGSGLPLPLHHRRVLVVVV
jgi:hypothetical protein